jgi:hypothetical protein
MPLPPDPGRARDAGERAETDVYVHEILEAGYLEAR